MTELDRWTHGQQVIAQRETEENTIVVAKSDRGEYAVYRAFAIDGTQHVSADLQFADADTALAFLLNGRA